MKEKTINKKDYEKVLKNYFNKKEKFKGYLFIYDDKFSELFLRTQTLIAIRAKRNL